jgi:hypothetical protein
VRVQKIKKLLSKLTSRIKGLASNSSSSANSVISSNPRLFVVEESRCDMHKASFNECCIYAAWFRLGSRYLLVELSSAWLWFFGRSLALEVSSHSFVVRGLYFSPAHHSKPLTPWSACFQVAVGDVPADILGFGVLKLWNPFLAAFCGHR